MPPVERVGPTSGFRGAASRHIPYRDRSDVAYRSAVGLVAAADHGAEGEHAAVAASDACALEQSLIGMGTPYDHREDPGSCLPFWSKPMQRGRRQVVETRTSRGTPIASTAERRPPRTPLSPTLCSR